MYWQFVVVGACSYQIYKNTFYYKIKFAKQLREICQKGTGFFNRQMETLKVRKFQLTESGFEAVIGIPYGLGFEDIEKQKALLETNLGAKEIILEKYNGGSVFNLTAIIKPFQDLKFEPKTVRPYEIYLGYSHNNHIIINMNSFPHMLISGCTGTGKSRLLFVILANLINRNRYTIEIYMSQIRKGDLAVFEDCYQVRQFSRNLQDTCNMLQRLNQICIQRDKQIDRYIKEGVYNIEDWNKRFNQRRLKYIYIFTDEFAFFMPSKIDTPDEKKVKGKCLAYIKSIVLTGRSTGIFIITSLQRPTRDSIPSDIKSQLNVRISFRQLDDASSIAILGNGNATQLEIREAIVQTNQEEHIKVPFIDHCLIKKNIADSIGAHHVYSKIEPETKHAATEPIIIEIPGVSKVIRNKKSNGVFDLNILGKVKNNDYK